MHPRPRKQDMPMASSKNKSLMRNLGEFLGHIIKGVKEDPNDLDSAKPRTVHEVRREVEEAERGNMILRRTTIEEIEFKHDQDKSNENNNADS